MKLLLLAGGVVLAFMLAAFVALEWSTLALPRLKVSRGASWSERQSKLATWLDQIEEKEKFNGTILIARKGKIVFERSIGSADASGRAFTSDTAFNMASVSKHMTAFAVLLLENDGVLSRDAPISTYLPELSRFDDVTVNHLLANTSGLPEYIADKTLRRDLKKRGAPLTPAVLIKWLQHPDQALEFPPGKKYAYRNTNYVLLAEIIARASGGSFAEVMQNRVFDPLGMQNTAVVNVIENTDALKDRAYGFRRRWIYFGAPVLYDLNYMDGAAGDGNIYSSGRDLLIWDRALRAGTLLPAQIYRDLAYAPVRLDDGSPAIENVFGRKLTPGMGWNVEEESIVSTYGHYRGFSNLFWRDLENDAVVIVLSNAGFFLRTAMIGDKIADLVAKP